jgi:hypothetical protein
MTPFSGWTCKTESNKDQAQQAESAMTVAIRFSNLILAMRAICVAHSTLPNLLTLASPFVAVVCLVPRNIMIHCGLLNQCFYTSFYPLFNI